MKHTRDCRHGQIRSRGKSWQSDPETHALTTKTFGGPSVGILHAATISLVDQISDTAMASNPGAPLVLLLTTPALGECQSNRGGLDRIQLKVVRDAAP